MSAIAELHTDLLETQAAIEQTKRAIADNPQRRSLFAALGSLETRQQTLEHRFLTETDAVGVDVCSYRMFSEDAKRKDPAILAVSAILSAFQKAFTLAYDAVRHGPKARDIVSQEIRDLTSFGFGYAFAGSTGVVLTVPRRQKTMLFEDDAVPKTAEAIIEMMNAKEPADVRKASQSFGPAVVRAVLSLSETHVKHKVGADIDWREGEQRITSGMFQVPQFRKLREAIRQTSDDVKETMTIEGNLVAVDTTRHTFRLEPDEGEIVAGRFGDAIDKTHHVEVPARYRAGLTRVARVQYSTEVEQVEYFLDSLIGPIGQ